MASRYLSSNRSSLFVFISVDFIFISVRNKRSELIAHQHHPPHAGHGTSSSSTSSSFSPEYSTSPGTLEDQRQLTALITSNVNALLHDLHTTEHVQQHDDYIEQRRAVAVSRLQQRQQHLADTYHQHEDQVRAKRDLLHRQQEQRNNELAASLRQRRPVRRGGEREDVPDSARPPAPDKITRMMQLQHEREQVDLYYGNRRKRGRRSQICYT